MIIGPDTRKAVKRDIGRCEFVLSLVLQLWISWLDLNRSLLFTTNNINEYTYCEYIGNIFTFLNRSLQESPVFAFIKTLIIRFCILTKFILIGELTN
jgi:hypothetical protein